MHDHHDHAHDSQTGAHADPHAPITEREELTYYEKRVQAISALLIEKGIVTADEIRRAIEDRDSRTPALGAKIVARAWVDPAFKARLLADTKAAVAELGVDTGSLIKIDVGRKHRHAAQRGGLHAMFLLSPRYPWPAAGLVQESQLSIPSSQRSTQRPERIWLRVSA